MNQNLVDAILKTLFTGLEISLPFLLVMLAVGLLVGLLQAATQINDPSIAFLAKLFSFVLCLIIFAPWAFDRIRTRMHENIQIISHHHYSSETPKSRALPAKSQ